MNVMKRIFLKGFFPILTIFILCVPMATVALTRPFEISGWIPYWRIATGTADTLAHLETFTEVNPFGYTVRTDGTLYDAAKLTPQVAATTTSTGTANVIVPSPWQPLIDEAHAKKIRVIPTVMWSNGDAIHATLKNTKARRALEDEIANAVKANNFDGIDIDFEGKKYETRNYFSTFLKGLYQRLGNKWLMCTIEARTPLPDRYYGVTAPRDAGKYANDLSAINKYCDRVRIMAYDQQSEDLKLAAQNEGTLYAPVADPVWVEKTMKLIAKSVSKKKLVLGVPTYGYEYDVTAYADGYTYGLLWSFNPGYAIQISQQYGVAPGRGGGGEAALSYVPTSTQITIPQVDATSAPTLTSSETAAAALALASSTNTHSSFRYLSWSDWQAIADKVALAKRLGLRGVAIFKIDGGEDPNIWNVLK